MKTVNLPGFTAKFSFYSSNLDYNKIAVLTNFGQNKQSSIHPAAKPKCKCGTGVCCCTVGDATCCIGRGVDFCY